MTNNILFGSGLWQKDMLEKIIYKIRYGLELDAIEQSFIDVQEELYKYPLNKLIEKMKRDRLLVYENKEVGE